MSNFSSLPNLLNFCFEHFSKFLLVANFENFAYSTILNFRQVASIVYIAFPKISNFACCQLLPFCLLSRWQLSYEVIFALRSYFKIWQHAKMLDFVNCAFCTCLSILGRSNYGNC